MGNAIGSELVIPENLTKSINEAEKKFKDLAKAGTDSATAIKTAFQSAAKDGIGQLNTAIKNAIANFGKLTTAANKAAAATNKISTGSGGTGVGKVGQDAAASTASITQLTTAVDALRKSMDTMNAGRSLINSDELKKAQANIADLQRQIADLQKQIASLQTTSKGKATKVVSVDDAQKLANEAKTLGEMQQAIKALQSAQRSLNLTEEEGRQKSQQLANEMARLKEACKQAMMSQQQLTEAQEKESAAAEKASVKNATFDTAMAKAHGATTYDERTTAIKACQSALQSLDTSVSDYNGKRLVLLATIEKLTDANKQWMVSAAQAADANAKAAEKEAADAKKVYEAKAKAYQAQNYAKNTTYEGAMSFADSANTINRRTQAIQYLTSARANLSTTDSQYAQKLAALNAKIKELNTANSAAVSGSKQLAASHSHLLNISGQLARSFALLFSVSQIRGYIKEIANVRGQFEMTQRSLQAILNDTQKANQIFNKTLALAVQSPYSIKDLTKFVRQLAAYRIESDKLYDTTKRLADVAAGLGVDMQRIILAYGQIKAANFLKGTEVRQLTEAGVNIYSELQSYFAEVKGLEYTTADIVSMISKKKVTFEDVEAVFQRMTDKGGMFYNMQLIQSETLQGKIMKFRDSVDIMLNDIGKSTEWLFKGTLDSMTALMKNWRSIRNAAYALLVVLGGIWARKGWLSMAASIRDSIAYMAALSGQSMATLTAMQRMSLAMKSFGTAIKTALGGWTGIGILAGIEILSFAISRIMEVNREANKILKESNDHYGEQMHTVRELAAEYRKLTEAKESANKAGTEIDEAKYLQDRRSKLIQLVEAMRKEGLDLDLEPFAINEDDLDATFDHAIERYKQFEREMLLVNAAVAESGGFAEDNVNKDLEQFQKAADKMLGMTLQLNRAMGAAAREDIWGALSEDQKKEWESINDLLNSGTDRLVAYTEAYERLAKMPIPAATGMGTELYQYGKGGGTLGDSPADIFHDAVDNMRQAKKSLESTAKEAVRELQHIFSPIKEDMMKIESVEERKRVVKAIISQAASQYNWGEEAHKLARRVAETEFQIRFTADEEALNDTVDWVSGYIDSYLKEHEFKIRFSANETELPMSDLFSQGDIYLSRYKKAKALADQMRKSSVAGLSRSMIEKSMREKWDFTAAVEVKPEYSYTPDGWEMPSYTSSDPKDIEANFQKAVTAYYNAQLQKLKNVGYEVSEDLEAGLVDAPLEEIEGSIDAFADENLSLAHHLGAWEDEKGRGYSTNSILKERISLLKEMEKRYEELRQVYSDAEAAQMTLAQYSDSIATSGLAQFLPAGYAPTKQGTADALRNLTGTAASQKDLTELLKDVAEYELKIKVDIEEESLKEAKDVVETAFSGYELFKDLQDTGLSEAAIKRMFPESGISTSLKDVADIIEQEMGGKEGTKWEDAYKEQKAKLDKQMAENTIKEYTEIFKNYGERLSEQLQLDRWYANERKKIEENDKYKSNPELQKRVLDNLTKDYNKKTSENKWTEFKSSDIYLEVFDNVGEQSIGMINTILARLETMKGSLKELSPESVRSITKAMMDLKDELRDRSPFAALGLDFTELSKGKDEIKKAREELTAATAEKNIAQNVVEEKTENKVAAEADLETAMQSGDIEAIITARANLLEAEEEQKAAETSLAAATQKEANAQDNLRVKQQRYNSSLRSMATDIKASISSITSLGNSVKSLGNALGQDWGGLEDAMDLLDGVADFTNTLLNSLADIGVNIGGTIQDTVDAVAAGTTASATSAATSISTLEKASAILAIIAAAIQLATIVVGLFNNDDSLEKKIENLKSEVENLERAFEKLEEAMTNALTTSDISSNYLSGIANLKQQIADYEEMIELERAKKDTDEDAIKEYQESIEDLEDQLEDYYNSYIEMLGGVSSDDFRSAAESFAEAWLDAFNEVEDTYDALIDNLQDYLNDMLVAQITNAASEQFIQPIIDSLNEMVEASGDITQLSKEDLDEWWSDSEDLLEQYNDFLEYYFSKLGISPSGSSDSSLSALQQGIQSITEETGAALESLLNSMRFYVATEQADVAIIKSTLLSMASSSTTTSASDPMLVELKAQTALLSSIDMRLSAVTKAGHPEGGRGLKVFLN